MKEWNILATAQKGQERYALRLLKNHGEFGRSGYRDVVLGCVDDVEAFLKKLEDIRAETPQKLRSLGQIVPLERNFQFEVADFMERAKEAISPYIDRLENTRFFVRVVRRGHKGEISGMETEKELDGFILGALEEKGKQAKVDIVGFEKMIIIETVENRAGVGLVTRAMKEKYPLIKVK